MFIYLIQLLGKNVFKWWLNFSYSWILFTTVNSCLEIRFITFVQTFYRLYLSLTTSVENNFIVQSQAIIIFCWVLWFHVYFWWDNIVWHPGNCLFRKASSLRRSKNWWFGKCLQNWGGSWEIWFDGSFFRDSPKQ